MSRRHPQHLRPRDPIVVTLKPSPFLVDRDLTRVESRRWAGRLMVTIAALLVSFTLSLGGLELVTHGSRDFINRQPGTVFSPDIAHCGFGVFTAKACSEP